MELSLVPMYDGETLMQEMIDLMRKNGFKLLAIGPGHEDYFTNEILQVEAIFYRT
jgi:CelD/BcsL family acetyltransferase involved in cellulose biosynthesis